MRRSMLSRICVIGTSLGLVLLALGCPPGPGRKQTVFLPGGVPLEMVRIPSGQFDMGRYPGEQDSSDLEDPRHSVKVRAFWMAKYEVTKAQWEAVMGTSPWAGLHSVMDEPDTPAVYVYWEDAKAFAEALSAYTGQAFRLPSEAEWEYACRADTSTRFYWGDDPHYIDIDDYAWWQGNAYDAGEHYAHKVGLKRPNAFGLYDMSGNVSEWCEDDFHENYIGAPANGGPWLDSPRTEYRLTRGGSWWGDPHNCRSASRSGATPLSRLNRVGFRIAK